MELLVVIVFAAFFGIIFVKVREFVRKKQLEKLNVLATKALNITWWKYQRGDDTVIMKSSKAVDGYSDIKYFQEHRDMIGYAEKVIAEKKEYANKLSAFLENNDLKNRPMYPALADWIRGEINKLDKYVIDVKYSSPTGRSTNHRSIRVDIHFLNKLKADPSLLMSKTEYNKYLKEKNQELVDKKQHESYDKVNKIIDLANDKRDSLVIKDDQEELDRLISSLFEKTVNSIKKIKTIDSEEWGLIDKVISNIDQDVNKVITRNQQILDYYNSPEFEKIKNTCDSLMASQKEFNEYINEKAQSISKLFGSRIIRNETETADEYNYVRPYKKSITPFTAEVSASVFASAENDPMKYIIKNFYPNKELYPEQIQKLQLLVEEIETLREAKQIIDNYKKDYQQYITDVPKYVMDNDEDGFYSRLGFANISESVLTVQYKFSYTSGGGMAQRSFTVPMTEENIVELINLLQGKLTEKAFAKEQRSLMTSKLRQHIKERDNFTCKFCENSTFKEPNLLLEIDHIIPVSKGGCTVEDNLQTLCWKCNRQKSSKIL